MTTGRDIAAQARELIGTPWKHQARCRGVGVDCIGLLVLTARACGVPIRDCIEYGPNPNPRRLISQLAAQFERVSGTDALSLSRDERALEHVAPGRVLVFAIARHDVPQHVGIASEVGVVHTYRDAGHVAEHALDREWSSYLHSVWAFEGVP